MDGKDKPPAKPGAARPKPAKTLRQRAEAALRGKAEALLAPLETLSFEAMRQALHELQVQKIQLEMQYEELRRIQAELDSTRERYFDFYDLAPVGYCTLSAKGLILHANLTTASLLKLARIALIKQRLSGFVQPEDRDKYYVLRQQVLTGGPARGCELRLINAEGATVWVYLQIISALDDDGEPVLRLVLSDISEHRQSEETIRLQAQALDQIRDRVTITDVHGVVTYLNRAGRDRPEMPNNGALGQHVSLYGDSLYADAKHQTIIDTTLTQGGWRGKVGHWLENGTEVIYDLRTTLVKDASGLPVAMVGVGTDITEQLKLEQSLRQREQYLRALLDNFPFMVWLKDLQGRYLAANQVFAAAHGCDTAEAVIGKRFEEVTGAQAAAQALAQDQAVLSSGKSQHFEQFLSDDGPPRWFETYKAPVLSGTEIVGTVGFSRDISERKQSEIELQAAKTEADRANLAKSRFLAAASHDLRQPIFALSLLFSALKNKLEPDSNELLTSIESCIENLSGLLTALLDVSKLEAGVIDPAPSDFSVDDMLRKLLTPHAAHAKDKGLALRWRHGDLIGRTDWQLLGRIVANFISNAVRYTEHGGVLIACRRHAGKHWIEVWDTGIGIPENKFEAIFEPFKQLGDEGRTRGSGLGLTIAEKTATLLGLQIRLRSRLGRGSMFAVELPLGQSIRPARQPSVRPDTIRLRIALVEDNTRVLQGLTLALESLGHELVVATTGKALLAQLGQQAPDIIISDYRLSGTENGFEVIAANRERFGNSLPALLLTGDTDPKLMREMAGHGIAVHYKPLRLDALQDFIQQAAPDRRSKR